MPKPTVIDPGDRGMVSQATGKPVYVNSIPASSVGQNDMQSFDDMVQTASMPSKTQTDFVSKPIPVFQPTVKSQAPKITSTQPVGLAGSVGRESESEATHDAFGLGLDRVDPGPTWESEAAEREGREERTENYFGEQYEQGSGGWYPALQDVYYGNTPQNDAYLRNAIDNGLSEDDAWAIMHRPQSIDEESRLRSERNVSDDLYANVGKSIDDGTSYDYSHMTSEWMTGPQYRRYVEMGMGGRDVNDIDPTRVYSKADEAREYDFTPFVPDMSSYASMATGDMLRVPGEIGTNIANARRALPVDYTISFGDGKTIDGKEFDRIAPTFLNNYYYNQQYAPERIKDMSGSETTGYVQEYAIPDSDGNTRYAYGDIVDSGYDDVLHLSLGDGTEVDVPKEEYDTWDRNSNGALVIPRSYGNASASWDDTYYLTFSDGQKIGLSQDYIRKNSTPDGSIDLGALASSIPVDQASGRLPDNIEGIAQESVQPNLVMSDGTVIPLEDVERIYWDETAGNDEDKYDKKGNLVSTDDDINYDFGFLNLGKPKRLIDQEPFDFSGEGQVFNSEDLLNNVIDWTVGSAPISSGLYLPWIYSGSQATNSLYGITPGSYDSDTGGRSLNAGGWDENGNLRYGVQDESGNIDDDLTESTRWWNTIGNAAVPLTEQLVGPVGEHIIPLEWATDRIPFKTEAGELLAKTLVGYGAEGVEEDLGNVFEDLMQYGPSGMFANPITNDDGSVLKDIYGHEVRDANTEAVDRAMNFANPTDLANAFLGGALVSPAMGLATTPINSGSFLRNIGPAMYRDYVRDQTGVNRYVETDAEREIREALEEGRIPKVPTPRTVSDRYASRFENVIGER